ncbi:MAG: hypothetical protein WKG00_18130 [Polyangiaceae bacterium]
MRPASFPLGLAWCGVALALGAGVANCGLADGTIDLLPAEAGVGAAGGTGPASSVSSSGSGLGGSGGGGAGGAGGCSFNLECQTPTPMCDRDTGACVPCPDGLVECDGACVDTVNHPDHCSACGAGCAHTQFCHGSACLCLPGTVLCDGACRDFSSDPAHCGACMHPCAPGEKCEASSCSLGSTCAAGLTACPQLDGTVACVNLATGYPRCGSCDVVCAPIEICAGGACQAYVPASPCTTCPCDDECVAALGPHSSCCDGLYGTYVSVCVAGDQCP